MTRHVDWEHKLGEFFLSRQTQDFQYGSNDCCLFACDCILAITGIDVAADFRGRYNSELSAARVILAFTEGGKLEHLAEKIAAQHGIEEVKPMFAQRGDIVLIEHDEQQALAVVGMDGWSVIGPGPRQFELIEARRAWRI
jgi:hypothetical protein